MITKTPFFNVKPLIAALQFLTIIPVPVPVSQADMEKALPWFPVAGLVNGSIGAAILVLAHALGLPPMMAGLLGVLAISFSNGFFHLDGVADTADGLLSARPKAKILEIMRDSRIGTMGFVGLFFILGLKWSALVSMAPGIGWRALIVSAVVARCAQVLTMGLLPYARKEGGLVSIFLKSRMPAHMVMVSVFGLLLAATMTGVYGIFAVLAAIVASVVFNGICMAKIDGITGDTLGALTEIVETTMLCVISVAFLGVV